MKKPLEQLKIKRQRGRLRGLFCQLSTISILLTPVPVRYCQPREDGSWVTGAPPQLRQGRPARCAGPRLGGTATTGPTPASPARHSSGGQRRSQQLRRRDHYYFNTCRVVQRKGYDELECAKSWRCRLDSLTRKKCMACRWRGCIKAGNGSSK